MIEIFDDRVEIYNPRGLPKGLSREKFGSRSVCRNPRIASLMFRCEYIEKMGTGIKRIRDGLKDANCKELQIKFNYLFTLLFPRIVLQPELGVELKPKGKTNETGHVTGQVTGQVAKLLKVLDGEMSKVELMDSLSLKGRDNFENLYLKPALIKNLIERTIPELPRSRNQKYRLTSKGKEILGIRDSE